MTLLMRSADQSTVRQSLSSQAYVCRRLQAVPVVAAASSGAALHTGARELYRVPLAICYCIARAALHRSL